MAETEVRMAIDPFKTVGRALSCAKKLRVPKTLVSVDYDDQADILYVKFKHAKIVDNEALDSKGLVTASLNRQGKIIGLIIMDASKFVAECKD